MRTASAETKTGVRRLSSIFRKRPKAPERLVIVRRQSPNWGDVGAAYWDDLAAFEAMIGWQPNAVRTLIAGWDASMSLPFFEFRRRVADITARNLAKVDARLIEIPQFRADGFDPAALYTFTDDDDWFCPSLAGTLRQARIRRDGIVWTSIRFDGSLKVRASDGFCYTNNYAILGSSLAEKPWLAAKAEQHFSLMEAMMAKEDVALTRLDAPLSVVNKHPASTLVLSQAAARHGTDGARKAAEAAKAQMRHNLDLPVAGIAWASGEIEEMRQLVLAL